MSTDRKTTTRRQFLTSAAVTAAGAALLATVPAQAAPAEDAAVAEFRETAEQLDADRLRLLLAYMRDLNSGRLTFAGDGSVIVNHAQGA